MVFNHLPHTQLHAIQNWLGWVSAAEGFFFISGVVVGIVYGRKAVTEGWPVVRRKLLERALHLYLANLALLFLFFGMEAYGLLQGNDFSAFWIRGEFQWPRLFAFNLPYYLHVLTRYVAFLLFAPLALSWLLAGKTRRLLFASTGLYLLGQLLGPNPRLPFFETHGYQAFPILMWQLLFFVGMVCGFHRETLSRFWRRWEGRGLGWAVVAASLGFIFVKRGIELGYLAIPNSWVTLLFDRTDLEPARLVNLAIFFAACFCVTDRVWKPLSRFAGPVLLPFGQASLYVFLVHIFVVVFTTELLRHLSIDLRSWTLGLLLLDLALLGLVWLLAKRRVLFGFIPA